MPTREQPVRTRMGPADEPEISVIYTSAESARAAMAVAGNLARRFGARINLVVPQIVPFPTSLADPPVVIHWNEARLRRLAEQASADTVVHVYLCRDRSDALDRVLRAHSFVVIAGSKRRWWPTLEENLARKLKTAGHDVIFQQAD